MHYIIYRLNRCCCCCLLNASLCEKKRKKEIAIALSWAIGKKTVCSEGGGGGGGGGVRFDWLQGGHNNKQHLLINWKLTRRSSGRWVGMTRSIVQHCLFGTSRTQLIPTLRIRAERNDWTIFCFFRNQRDELMFLETEKTSFPDSTVYCCCCCCCCFSLSDGSFDDY